MTGKYNAGVSLAVKKLKTATAFYDDNIVMDRAQLGCDRREAHRAGRDVIGRAGMLKCTEERS